MAEAKVTKDVVMPVKKRDIHNHHMDRYTPSVAFLFFLDDLVLCDVSLAQHEMGRLSIPRQ